MKTQYITSPSIADRVRSAASSSLLVRSALIATLAITVTVGGVLVGALVVAPVVARASQPGTTAQVTRTITAFSTAALSASRLIATRGADAVADTMASLPQPMTRYALAGLGLVAIIGAFSPRLLRRRTPMRSLTSADADAIGRSDLAEGVSGHSIKSTFGSKLLTPRSTPRVGSKRNQTPRAVEALAATGASAGDIAWKTGLPIDAVRLLLAISTATRQLQPPAA
jgi:hypothetical protein